MQNFNIVPSTGTFGKAIDVVNSNFELTKEQLEKVAHTRENCLGLFADRAKLVESYPEPSIGQFAYVGNSTPFYIYKCITDGVWPSTSSDTFNPSSVDLTDYAKKETVDNLYANTKYYVVQQSSVVDGTIKVDTNGYQLFVGGSIKFKMGFPVLSSDGLKLNINNTGDKNLYYNGNICSPSNSWEQNEIIEVFYDGEKYIANKVFDRKILEEISENLSSSSNLATIGAIIRYINSIHLEGFLYKGIANPSSTPAAVSTNIFYIAIVAGTYTNFGGLVVSQGVNILKYDGTGWTLESVFGIDDEPTAGSDNLVKSGGVHKNECYVSESYKGYIDSGNWKDLGTGSRKYKVTPISVNGGEAVTIKGASAGNSVVCFLSAYNPVEGQSAGVLLQKIVSANTTVTDTVPSGSKYLYVLVDSSGANRTPQEITIDNIDILGLPKDNIFQLQKRMSVMNAQNANLGICSSSIATVDKVVKLANYQGGFVPFVVIMTNNGNAENITLNVNGTGALPLYINGLPAKGRCWNAGDSLLVWKTKNTNNEFIYDSLINRAQYSDFALFSLREKPNIVTADKKIVFPSDTTIVVNNINYTISANTEFSLAASGTAYSIIVFKPNTGEIVALNRESALQGSNIVIGNCVWISGYNQFHFLFDYTVDGIGKDDYATKNALSLLGAKVVTDSQFRIDEIYKGFINAGQWADIGEGARYYKLIDITEFDGDVLVKGNPNGQTVIQFLSSHEPENGSSIGILSGGGIVEINETKVFSIPSEAKYLYYLYESYGQNRTPQQISIATIDLLASVKQNLANINKAADEVNGVGILNFNPRREVLPKLLNLKNAYRTLTQNPIKECLTLLHFSDIHNEGAAMDRINVFAENYSNYIDDIIHTGDLLNLDLNNSINAAWKPGWLNVIGNHDATYKVNGVYTLAPQSDSYDKIFAPYINEWDIESAGEDLCYYYKDYASKGFRLIVLDNMTTQYISGDPLDNHWNTAQKDWFVEKMAETRDPNNAAYGLHVIVAVHYPAFVNIKTGDNPFDSIDYSPNQICNSEIPQLVKAHIDAGGVFVCYLTGHTHYNLFGLNATYPNQLMITVPTASVLAAKNYDDEARENGNKTQDCFSLISFDAVSKTIKLMRIGADYDRYMRRKNTLSWDYNNSQLIYCD